MNKGCMVFHRELGEGILVSDDDTQVSQYPVKVQFFLRGEIRKYFAWFTSEGKSNIYDLNPSLIYSSRSFSNESLLKMGVDLKEI